VARVTLVVNEAGAGSETFLRAMASILVDIGHDVTVHALLAGRATAAGDGGTGGTSGADRTGRAPPGRSGALPSLRSPRFLRAAAHLARTHPDAAGKAGQRALQRFGPGPRALSAAALAAPILATGPDVVHLGFSGIAVALHDALELLDPGTRIVVSCRGSGELVQPVIDPTLGPRLGQALARADAVHVVSDAVGAVVRGLGVGPERVHLIRPAIDTTRFAPRGPRRPPGEVLQLVTVGRLHWVKSVETQIDAVALLAGRGRDVRLTVVGDGPERLALTFRADVLGVADRVRLVGAQPPDRVRDLVEEADAFVLSSWSEGTSNAVLEAMALAVPVVSTDVGGMPEVIAVGHDGMLVPPGDPGTLAGAVERLFDQGGSAGRLGDAGRQTVLGGFTLDRQRDDIRAMYRAVLG